MPFINCEINVIPVWFGNYSLVAGTAANQVLTFPITDAKRFAPVVTLSTKENAKQLKLNNSNLVLKEQLTGININLK